MHELKELREMLCDALKGYGAKSDLGTQSLDVVDKLAHAIKNIDKIIESDEWEGQSRDGGSYRRGRMYRGTYEGSYDGDMSHDNSYARGRYAKRDSMGRYSREGYSRDGMTDQLHDLMNGTDDEKMRSAIQKILREFGD